MNKLELIKHFQRLDNNFLILKNRKEKLKINNSILQKLMNLCSNGKIKIRKLKENLKNKNKF